MHVSDDGCGKRVVLIVSVETCVRVSRDQTPTKSRHMLDILVVCLARMQVVVQVCSQLLFDTY